MDGWVLELLAQFGLPAIFLAILLEYACFPVSSEIVLPLSGMLAAEIGTPLWLLILLSIAAGLSGCSVCYWVGRCGDRFLERVLQSFPRMAVRFEKTCNWQRRHGRFAVLFGRVVPLFRTYISFAAGLVKQSYSVFLGFSAVGIAVWNTLLLAVGYLLGESGGGFIPAIQKFLLLLVSAAVLALVVRAVLKRRRAK